ncbi:MAG: hypothetical protein KJ006_01440 [Thermoleophilia bacterium]|nr:hypothetical protein [Thermoleophilia bacterium]
MRPLETPPAAPPPAAEQPAPASAGGLPWFDRIAWPLFAAAAVIATGLILWWGRDLALSVDEMDWFMESPAPGLGAAFEPHVGHLILTTRLAYEAIFSTLGVGYLPFQLLTAGVVVLAAGLFFAYAQRRVGRLVAFGPTMVLLFFGSDPLHLLAGNGFTVIGALACGLGALLALDRDDRGGDVMACALLCLGVVTYSVALPFVVGVAVAVALRDDRRRRAWVAVVPAAAYVAWWLWALGSESSSDGQISLVDVLLFPSWAYQSLSGVLGALAGLDYPFGDGAIEAGPTLAVLALIGVGWRLRRGPVPAMAWAALAIALALWLLGVVSVGTFRAPDSPRYLYPGALVVLIAGAWLAAGLRWGRPALVAVCLLAAAGVATNLAQLRTAGAFARAEAAQQRAALAGFEIAGANADARYVPEDGPPQITFWTGHTAGDYLEAAGRYGSIGYAPAEVRALPAPLRELTDESLVGALGLALAPAAGDVPRRGCLDLGPGPGGAGSLELAPGQALTLESGQPAAVSVARFADPPGVAVGTLPPGEAMTLAPPADGVADPWRVSAAAPVRACAGA